MDWWIICAEGITVLNSTTVFVVPNILRTKEGYVGKVTILLTQFSFANWFGNNADEYGK